jgi:hypothetical protein
MFHDDPRKDACTIAELLAESVVRSVFRALVRERDTEAKVRLMTALGPAAASLDLEDPVFREWFLEALGYRISPPDEEDAGLTRPWGSGSFTLSFGFEREVA